MDPHEITPSDWSRNLSRGVSTAKPEPEIDLAGVQEKLMSIERDIADAVARHNAFLEAIGGCGYRGCRYQLVLSGCLTIRRGAAFSGWGVVDRGAVSLSRGLKRRTGLRAWCFVAWGQPAAR
tara:strand:- start:1247 stop:1612 length:366 start_codon:yes stop_codon:yes gene_type:complete